MKLGTLILVAALALTGLQAHASKRMGGGKSVGQQSNNVTQHEAAKPAHGTPAQAAPAASPAPAAAPMAQPQRRPWGAMLGGLAAGMGLAWLAHSLGLGAEFGEFMMFALLALVIMVAVGYFLRRRQGESSPSLAFQGAAVASNAPASYNPRNVGNDASARPWESTSTSFQPLASPVQNGAPDASHLPSGPNWSVPVGFDVQGFVHAAKQNFLHLQDAWDRSDIPALRAMMTDTMLAEIKAQLAEREANSPGQANKTEVLSLDAQLLGVEELPNDYLASVEFTGMIREDAHASPSPFREVWNMGRPKTGDMGWLVAGVQAFQ